MTMQTAAPSQVVGDPVVQLSVSASEVWLLGLLRQIPFGTLEVTMHGGRIVGLDEHRHHKPPPQRA